MRLTYKTVRKSIVAFIILFFFTLFSFCSVAFILISAGHAHDFDGGGSCCTVCVKIQSVDSILNQLAVAFVGMPFSYVALLVMLAVLSFLPPPNIHKTLVNLKIRLNN